MHFNPFKFVCCIWPRTHNSIFSSVTAAYVFLPQHLPTQAISAENFSQSEYLAVGAIFPFPFPLFHRAFHLPFHHAFHYVNLSNMCSKQAFYCINLSNVGFFIASQSVRSFGRSPSPSKVLKLFQSLKIALTHMPLRESIEIAWTE